MKTVRTEDAVGHILCHDITRIVRGVVKDTPFRRNQMVREEDIPLLLSLGKDHLYVWDDREGMIHEDDAAQTLYDMCAGEHMSPSGIREGKIEISATTDGYFSVDIERLRAVNSLGEIAIATRHRGAVRAGDRLAGMRVIPLTISEEKMEAARRAAGLEPLFAVHPYRLKQAGIVATGNEVFHGRIADTFTPVLEEKLGEYGVEVCRRAVLPDDHERITRAILDMAESGAELVLCSGGMSVDPDDRTPLAIKNTGARIVSYGSPVLPGAMFMLAYLGGVPVVGLPGCVMYAKRTVFDLVLPRLLAGLDVDAAAIAGFGHGGLCLNCEPCTYPNCGFGKGV